MANITEMRQKRAAAWDKAKRFLDDHRNESGLLSAEDTATYDAMEREVVNLGSEITRLERAEALDREMAAPTSAALKGRIELPGAAKQGRATDEYRSAFWQQMRNHTSFEVRNALQLGTDSEGGFLAPEEFERTLVEALQEENVFRALANVIQTSSGDRKIPIVASKGMSSWVDEEGLIPDSDDAFGQVSIAAYKLATTIKVSDELLNDSVFNLEAYIAKEFGRRIGAGEEQAFITGDGTGKPTGIMHATLGAQLGTTTASATAITMDELIDLFYSLKAPYRKNASFMMNDATVTAIRKLKNGQGEYLWQPSVQVGQPDTILNRPVITSAYVPTIAAGAKVIAFGDFKYYWIGDRQGRSFKRLNELYAATGQVGFIASQRVDGKLVLPEAIKVLQMKA